MATIDLNATNDGDDEAAAIKGEMAAVAKYEAMLQEYPDCRDPSHPGCSLCEFAGDLDEQDSILDEGDDDN